MPRNTYPGGYVNYGEDLTGPLWIQGTQVPEGAPPGQDYSDPQYWVGQPGQTNFFGLIGGNVQSKIIPGTAGLTIRNNADTVDEFLVGGSGGATIVNAAPNGGGLFLGGGAGAASSTNEVIGTYTGIADATATPCMKVSVPNIAVAARLNVSVLASLGAGGAVGAFEASAISSVSFVIARTPGVVAVIAGATATGATTAAVSGATTITLAVAASSESGSSTATNTFTINVTITKGGGSSTNHQAIISATLLNATAGGVTIVA